MSVCGTSALVLAACGAPSAKTIASELNSGVTAQRAGNYNAAISDYQDVISAQPKNVTALFDLGDVKQEQHLYADAKSYYLQALAIDPTMVSALYNLAVLEASSSPVEAEALYKQVISLSPKDAAAYFNLGYVLTSLGQRRAGQADIDHAVKLDPSLKSRLSSSTTTTTLH